MTLPAVQNRLVRIALIALFAGILDTGILLVTSTAANSGLSPQTSVSTHDIGSTETINQTVYLPILANNYPWISPFGIESNRALVEGSTYLTRTVDLDVGWVRMGTNRVSWRDLQPEQDDIINWDSNPLLEVFENELRTLNSAGITPVVIVQDSPRWATTVPTSCGPIREDKFPAFASFMEQLVNRYKTPEFNVHNWEIGNEPDIDPDLVRPDNGFGCWGDIEDPYYGGRHYGEMLKYITPYIRAADPTAKVWIGGLLLGRPDSASNPQCPDHCRPELFFEGILVSGAAPYFDIVPYHWYRAYFPPADDKKIDYDKNYHAWEAWGGGAVGKSRFLRQLMSEYGVDKPVSLNEIGLMCRTDPGLEDCNPTEDTFLEAQADFLVRTLTRALSEDVMGYAWYTLESPGWQNSSLLDVNQEPRRSYIAYQHISQLLQNAIFMSTVDYGSDIEAYAFKRGSEQVHVLWRRTDLSAEITVPPGFIEAFEWDGTLLPPSSGQLTVGFSPIYIILSP